MSLNIVIKNMLWVLMIFIMSNVTSLKLHLSKAQIQSIDQLIKNPRLTLEQRSKINYILYCSYEKWAIKMANNFIYLHRNKCRNLTYDDIVMSSKIGLFKSIQKYNGCYYLLNYSYFFVKGEMLKTLTEHHSASSVQRSLRIRNKQKFTTDELVQYNRMIGVNKLDYVNYSLFDSSTPSLANDNDNNNLRELWEQINELDPFSKRVILLKYDSDFKRRLTNKQVAEIMCCSEETIRKIVIRSLNATRIFLHNKI